MENEFEVILGNSNKNFSGVTSTMLQVLSIQQKIISIAVLGDSHLPEAVPAFSFFSIIKILKTPLVSGMPRVFHARRNDEMIQALTLKFIFGIKLKIIFTSTAQRKKTWITRWLMSAMDGLVSTCSAAANYMPTPPDVIIPHGIDSSKFFTVQTAEQSVGLPNEFNIGIFGRVREQKGIDLLIDAAIEFLPKFPHWGVVVVGEVMSDQQGYCDEQILKLKSAALDGRVMFTGKVSFAELPQYFSSVDIVTALSRNEGFGLTVLEAMSASKPVVATKAGAWPDIIDDGVNGFLIDVDDCVALGERLSQLASNEQLRASLGVQARSSVVSNYTVEREAQQLIDYYKEVQRA